MSGSEEGLLRVLHAPCQALGVRLDDVELRAGVLRVTVDRTGGLDLEELAAVSRAVSLVLEEHDDLVPSARYHLEVSTPGVERRLRRPEQFARALGERVALRTVPGTPGERRVEGTLRAADDQAICLELEGGEQRRLAYGELERARTVFDWQGELSARRAEERAARAEGLPSPAVAPRAGARQQVRAGRAEIETRERATRP